jgi:hypothetical protein
MLSDLRNCFYVETFHLQRCDIMSPYFDTSLNMSQCFWSGRRCAHDCGAGRHGGADLRPACCGRKGRTLLMHHYPPCGVLLGRNINNGLTRCRTVSTVQFQTCYDTKNVALPISNDFRPDKDIQPSILKYPVSPYSCACLSTVRLSENTNSRVNKKKVQATCRQNSGGMLGA